MSGNKHVSYVYWLALAQLALSVPVIIGAFTVPEPAALSLMAALAVTAVTLATLLVVLVSPPANDPIRRLIRLLFEGRVRSRMAVVALLVIAVAAGLSAVTGGFTGISLPTLAGVLAFIVIWPWITIGLLIALTDAARHKVRSFAVNLSLGLVSLAAFGALLEGALQVAFPALPTALTARMPQAGWNMGVNYDTPYGARQYPPNQAVDYIVDERHGDIVAPYCGAPQNQTFESPYRLQFVRDSFGFRNSAVWPEQVDLVVVGDSFADGENVQSPFWEGLPVSTLGLGIGGAGNLEQLAALREFGVPRQPRVVVMTYFEGNDLLDNWRFEVVRSQGENYGDIIARNTPPVDYLVTYNLLRWAVDVIRQDNCPQPVADAKGQMLAFADDYLSVLTLDEALLRQSQVFAVTRSAILDTAVEVRNLGATFVLAYIPVKAHAYWNQLAANDQIEALGALTVPLELGDFGFRYDEEAPPGHAADLLAQNYDDQRRVLAELAEQSGFLFLDFTPHLQAAAAEGEMLYFYADTHWNQRGHDVARQAIGEFLKVHGLMAGSRPMVTESVRAGW